MDVPQPGCTDASAELHALRQRVAELEDFLERAAEGLHMVGPDGTIQWANQAELAMLGYSREEYIGRKIQEFHVDPPVVADFLDRLVRGETFQGLPARLWCRDGSIKHVVVSSSGNFRDGEFICTRCITRDVSRERDAEEALARLAAIVESTDDAVIGKGLDGVMSSWNTGAQRLYGYAPEEMIGISIFALVPLERHGEERDIIARVGRGESLTHYETVRLAKDGRRVPVSLTISPVRDTGGRIIGVSSISRDISARVDAERRKDEFLAILAHELRNPLAPVRNALAVLREPDVSAEQRQRVQAIAERQTEHMARLLEDLLDVARISTGRVELRRQRLALGPLLLDAVDTVRPQLDAKRHALELAIEADGVWIDADPVRMQQVIGNLLNNAVKYTDPGGTIKLSCHVQDGRAVIAVRDNGIGFGPDVRARLFTLFSQAQPAGARASGGLGIGLALVREFVERHGGAVDAHSEGPMRGSEFVVRIPCEQADEAQTPAALERASTG